MLDFLFSIRAIESIWLPASLAAALIAWSPQLRRLSPTAPAIAIAFLFGFLLIRPFPIWPMVGAEGPIPYLILPLLAIASMADIPRVRIVASLLFIIALPILASLVIGRGTIGPLASGRGLLLYPLLALSGALVFSRLIIMGERRAGGYALLLPAIGLVLLAQGYGTRIWLLALPLASALAGALLATTRLDLRWPLSASLTAGGIWFFFAVLLIAKRDLLALPTAILFLAFLAPSLADRLAPRRGGRHLAIILLYGAAVVALSRLSLP